MTTPAPESSATARRLPGRAGLSEADVFGAADALLREGVWPTWQRIRERTGSGSPNTIVPILRRWFQRLGSRLESGPAALHRLPEGPLHILEGLYQQLLESARRQTGEDAGAARKSVDQARSDLQIRSHVLSLRESELEQQIKERTRTLDTVQGQVSALTALLARATADKSSAERRAGALEAELNDVRRRFTQLLAQAVIARRRAARRSGPKKPPVSAARATRRARVTKKPKATRRPARKATRRRSR